MSPKAALVTGGGTGLGLAMVREFLAAGFRVVVFAPEWDPVPKDSLTGDLHEVRVDLSEPEQILRAFEEAGRPVESVDVLVNNAAVFERKAFAELRRAGRIAAAGCVEEIEQEIQRVVGRAEITARGPNPRLVPRLSREARPRYPLAATGTSRARVQILLYAPTGLTISFSVSFVRP